MNSRGVKQIKKLYDQKLDLVSLTGKVPTRSRGWVKAPRVPWSELEQDLKASESANVGLRCGHPLGRGYGGTIDLDIVAETTEDENEIIRGHLRDMIGDQTAPEVISGFGHGLKHFHVLTKEPEPKRKLFKATRQVTYTKGGVTKTGPVWQMEFIGTGGQVVLPPSIHPDTGNEYKWVNGGIKVDELPMATLPPVRPRAKASVGTRTNGELLVPELERLPIASYYKQLIRTGDSTLGGYPSRSEALFACLIVLARDTKLDDAEILALVLDVESGIGEKAREKGDAAMWLLQQLEVVRGTLSEEAEHAGLHARTPLPPAACEGELVGEQSSEADNADPIAELQQECSLVLWGGKLVVYRERKIMDELEGKWHVLPPSTLKTIYANRTVRVPAGNGESKLVNPVDLWMRSPDRKEYFEGVRLVCPPEECPSGVFNLWQGWGVKAWDKRVTTPMIALWLSFVLDVICAGDKELARWVHAWIADLFKDPGNPKGVALVLRSGEGTGKGTFCELLSHIVGNHYRHVTQESQLTGRFNAHFADSLLVNANEMIWAADRRGHGQLYAMITDGNLMLERKGYDAIPMRNRNRFIVSSNSEWVVPAGIDARRWMLLDCLNAWQNKLEKFAVLRAWAFGDENEGLRMLLRYYQDLDTSGINLRKPPATEGLVDQKLANFDNFRMWWHEVLERGSVSVPIPGSELPWEGDEEHAVDKSRVYGSYTLMCKEAGVHHALSNVRFFRRLHRLVLNIKTVQPRTDRGGRIRKLIFPPLEELRAIEYASLRS